MRDLNEGGNKFQTVGPHTGNANGPKIIVLVRDTVQWWWVICELRNGEPVKCELICELEMRTGW